MGLEIKSHEKFRQDICRNNRKCRHDADLMTWNPPPALSGRMDLSKSTKEEKFHAKKKNTRKKH